MNLTICKHYVSENILQHILSNCLQSYLDQTHANRIRFHVNHSLQQKHEFRAQFPGLLFLYHLLLVLTN